MARTCSICVHDKRQEIDAAIVAGTSFRDISRQFSVGKDAVSRHKAHLQEALSQAQEQRAEEALDILKEMDRLRKVALGLLVQAKDKGELRAAIAALREARETLIRQGELLKAAVEAERPVGLAGVGGLVSQWQYEEKQRWEPVTRAMIELSVYLEKDQRPAVQAVLSDLVQAVEEQVSCPL